MPRSRLSDRDRTLLFGSDTLQPGDAVVHFEHGLARYEGETTVHLGDEAQVLTTFIYRHGGKLMLPAEEGRDFWAYGGPAAEVTLDRLKASDWVRRRDEMIAELRQGAAALLAQDAARRAQSAWSLTPPPARMAAFTDGFPHEETEDQARAIDAVLADLTRDVPMDRLLVGDVGFGKTEVALRAIAACALAGRQVVMAAPTTVLARQHAETLRDRFAPLDIEIAELSRLTPADDRDELVGRVAEGDISIVVGTQALLADDVEFAELALLVIDEEQKFGREQKLGLRRLAPGMHVLSMTATPIPRTLAAAEIGLVDVSVVATAPGTRQPIETHICDFDADILSAAIADEAARGGQVYVVCPRIEGLARLEQMLAAMDDEVRHVTAHGQMSDAELEAKMLAFMAGDAEVLLSTAIIESGLDNSRANTMIVCDADLFGLAQLHQLRGRVGRGQTAARMWLVSEAGSDGEAGRRLAEFAERSQIGAGFEIARRDRDARGFGELEGTEQSGQSSRLGLGLYRHILREFAEIEDEAIPPGEAISGIVA